MTLVLDEREQTVVEFGQCLAQPFARVPDELYERLARVVHGGADRGADGVRGDDGGDERREQCARGPAGRVPAGQIP